MIKESEIVRQITDYLDARKIFYIRNLSGHVRGRNINGATGVSDLLVIRNGVSYAVEVKRVDGVISTKQFHWLERFKAAGGKVIVACSVEDVQRGLG